MAGKIVCIVFFAGMACTGCCAKTEPPVVVRFSEPARAENKWEYETESVKVTLGLVSTKPISSKSGDQVLMGHDATVLVVLANKRSVVGFLDYRKSYTHNIAYDPGPRACELIPNDVVFPPGWCASIRKEVSTKSHITMINSNEPQSDTFSFWWGGGKDPNEHHNLSMPQSFSIRVVWDDGRSEDEQFTIMTGPETEIAACIDTLKKTTRTHSTTQPDVSIE